MVGIRDRELDVVTRIMEPLLGVFRVGAVELVVETRVELLKVPWLGWGFVINLLDVLLCPWEIDGLVALLE